MGRRDYRERGVRHPGSLDVCEAVGCSGCKDRQAGADFTSFASLDLVYTPRFDPDRYITGEYVSHWNGSELAGRDNLRGAQIPGQWFKDDEIALRLYKNIHNYELVLYGYRGFWKQPAGQSGSGEHLFPELSVYGFSARGRVGRGIGNLEFAYYRSGQDRDGTNPIQTMLQHRNGL
ncbi:hypothetical protein [Desulfobacter sp.]|uniref:hypothetical protein n=1 Tax=Desulfobacter sp. TaxID=2294 RepID=UPI003D0CA77C